MNDVVYEAVLKHLVIRSATSLLALLSIIFFLAVFRRFSAYILTAYSNLLHTDEKMIYRFLRLGLPLLGIIRALVACMRYVLSFEYVTRN